MKFTDKALALLKQLEGCRLTAYKDQAGVWTIGYGHTAHVSPGDTWTQDEADAAIMVESAQFASAVAALIHPLAPLSDNEFSAIVIFAYNEGIHALAGSTLLRHINGGLDSYVPADMRQWDKIHVNGQLVVDPGLQKRREAEIALWNS